jgi:hypothetical protein
MAKDLLRALSGTPNNKGRIGETAAGQTRSDVPTSPSTACPVCGAIAVVEKCKLVCHSDICRGRVIMNCSEF